MTPLTDPDSIPITTVSATDEPKITAPPWLAQFVVIVRLWSTTGLLERLS